MKLAFCLYRYFPFGGLQKDMRRMAEAAVEAGHSVQVFCGRWEGERPSGITVTELPVQANSNHRRDALLAEALVQAARASGAHLVVGFNRMPGLDVYYAADSCFAEKLYEQRPWLLRFLPRYRQHVAMERAVFAADSSVEVLMIAEPQIAVFQHYYGTPGKRLHVLPPGISRDRIAGDDALARRAALRQQQQVGDDEHVLLMVGSGFRTKGLDRAIQALANLPEALRARSQLWVVGQDDERRYRRQARLLRVSDRVHFLGGRSDVPDFLLAADVLLHPAYRENTGTVLLEALVAGLPVIASSVCGYASHVRDYGFGDVLPEPFRQRDLDDALIRQLAGPSRAVWLERSRRIATDADFFSLPQRAVETLERIAGERFGTLP